MANILLKWGMEVFLTFLEEEKRKKDEHDHKL